jgi:polyisoprenyl-phosphate glycosyltransferase
VPTHGSALIPKSLRREPVLNLDILVPCFNEEEALEATAATLLAKLEQLVSDGRIGAASSVLFIDDCSRDGTWELIKALARRAPDGRIHGVRLSHNKGHQNAVLAGLHLSTADMVISIDADLQDDVDAIDQMLVERARGSNIVFGVHSSRETDTWFKRTTAQAYYRLLQLCGVRIVFNHADFRLLDRRAIDALKEYPEVNLFLRGLVTELGFKTAVVAYRRGRRTAGVSKYPPIRMLGLAWDGLTSFSTAPIRWITLLGMLVALGTFACSMWVLWVALVERIGVPGWASTVLPIYFLGGVQLIAIGIIGEYLAKIYLETKRRPRFTIEESF